MALRRVVRSSNYSKSNGQDWKLTWVFLSDSTSPGAGKVMCFIYTCPPPYSKMHFGWKPKIKSIRTWLKADNILLCRLGCDNLVSGSLPGRKCADEDIEPLRKIDCKISHRSGKVDAARRAGAHGDGVMVGRAAYKKIFSSSGI